MANIRQYIESVDAYGTLVGTEKGWATKRTVQADKVGEGRKVQDPNTRDDLQKFQEIRKNLGAAKRKVMRTSHKLRLDKVKR